MPHKGRDFIYQFLVIHCSFIKSEVLMNKAVKIKNVHIFSLCSDSGNLMN